MKICVVEIGFVNVIINTGFVKCNSRWYQFTFGLLSNVIINGRSVVVSTIGNKI